MLTIYLLDISQSIKGVGSAFMIISLILFVIGGFFFSISGDYARGSDKFKESRGISSYLISAAIVIALIGFCAIIFTPSKENSQYFIEQLKQEIAQ